MIRLISYKVAAIITMLAMGLTGAAYKAASAKAALNPGGDGDRDGSACGETVHAAGKMGSSGFDRDDSQGNARSSDADWQADQALLNTGANNSNFAQISKLFANGKLARSGRFSVPAWALGHRFVAANGDDGCATPGASARTNANNANNNTGANNTGNMNNNGAINNGQSKQLRRQNTRLINDIDKLMRQVQLQIQVQTQAQASGQASTTTIQNLEALQTYLIQLRAQLVAENAALPSRNGRQSNNNNNNNTANNNNNNTNGNTGTTQSGQATTVAPSTGTVATATPGAVATATPGAAGTATPGAGIVPNTGATSVPGAVGTATPGAGVVPNTGATGNTAPTNDQLVVLIDQLMQQVQVRIQAETQAQANGQGSSVTLTALQDLQACLTQARAFLAGGTPSPLVSPSATPSPAPSVTPTP